jgi:hypothetical protein
VSHSNRKYLCDTLQSVAFQQRISLRYTTKSRIPTENTSSIHYKVSHSNREYLCDKLQSVAFQQRISLRYTAKCRIPTENISAIHYKVSHSNREYLCDTLQSVAFQQRISSRYTYLIQCPCLYFVEYINVYYNADFNIMCVLYVPVFVPINHFRKCVIVSYTVGLYVDLCRPALKCCSKKYKLF